MHSIIKVRYLIFPILLLIFILEGCGSGDEPTPADNDDPPPVDNTNVNQGLTGYLYTAAPVSTVDLSNRYPVIIDLATGEAHRILHPLILNSYFSAPYPSNDGRILVLTGDNQDCSTTFSSYYDDCVFLARPDQPIEMLNPMEISAHTRISPNGSMLAAIGRLNGGDISTKALRLISLEGELLQTVGDFDVGSFTWLPDGRLMFVWDQTIYLTNAPYDLNATAVYTYNNGEGGPVYLSPSHDGTRIAFTVNGSRDAGVGYSYVMVMNIDGSGLRQLTDSAADDVNPGQHYPVWSPGDQWIMVHNSLLSGYALYAVRSSATRVILDDDQYAPGDAIKIQSDLHDHLYNSTTENPAGLTAWLSVAPFLNASARPLSETNSLPQHLNGEWIGPCRVQGFNTVKTTLQFSLNHCAELEQLFSDANCNELAGESKRSTNCHFGESVITDSGLTATQLILEDESVLAGKNIVYQDGDQLYVGQGNTLELELPFTQL